MVQFQLTWHPHMDIYASRTPKHMENKKKSLKKLKQLHKGVVVGFLNSESRGIHMGNWGIGKWLSWHPSTGIKGAALCPALFLWVCAHTHRQEEDIVLPGAVLDTRKKLWKKWPGPELLFLQRVMRWLAVLRESTAREQWEHILEVLLCGDQAGTICRPRKLCSVPGCQMKAQSAGWH